MDLSISLETIVLSGVGGVVAYAGWTFRKMAETVQQVANRLTVLETEHKLMSAGCRRRHTDVEEVGDMRPYRAGGGDG